MISQRVLADDGNNGIAPPFPPLRQTLPSPESGRWRQTLATTALRPRNRRSQIAWTRPKAAVSSGLPSQAIMGRTRCFFAAFSVGSGSSPSADERAVLPPDESAALGRQLRARFRRLLLLACHHTILTCCWRPKLSW